MYVKLSELKTNPAKYFDLAKTTDVIVTRHGQRLGRIVCEEKVAEFNKAIAFSDLIKLTKTSSSVADDTVYDPIKEERLREW